MGQGFGLFTSFARSTAITAVTAIATITAIIASGYPLEGDVEAVMPPGTARPFIRVG